MTKSSLKLMLIAGARPNFMKVAPIIRQIEARQKAGQPLKLEYRLVHTGQHYDRNMSGVFFDELGIPEPDVNLEAGSGTQAVQTANVMTRFEPVCERERPDWVVVVGDVTPTMACTLVCAKLGIRVAHVEAGLRSFDREMPEEVNRIVTDALADLLLTPSADANENLQHEGADPAKVKCVGNVMIDTLVANLDRAHESRILERLDLEPGGFAYVTLHRPSNVDGRRELTSILAELERIASHMPVVFPMHPRTRKMCAHWGIETANKGGLRTVEPLGYHDSLRLAEAARFVLTDSGGLQEETTFFRTPCLTLRPNTERPVTITTGSNQLTRPDRLSADVDRLLAGPSRFGQIPPMWDGQASERVVEAILAAS